MTGPGDRAGQENVFNEVAMGLGLVRGMLRRRVPPCMVDDLVQETFVRALRHIQEGGFRPPEDRPLRDSVRAWLGGIVKNLAKDYQAALARYLQVFCSPPRTRG